MTQEESLLRRRLKAPKAAAIAGIVFSVLLIISLVLLLIAVPANPREGGAWLSTSRNTILLALNLVPFSGIAFLWFIGVVRDRLGEYEDQFFATVFLGSGLLFLAMLFAFAAMTGGIILLYLAEPDRLLASGFYDFGYTTAREIMHTYALKMAGVFMISTCTIFIRTRVIPRWIGLLGYALAALMILRISQLDRMGWVSLVFPLWVLLISVYILIDNYRRKSAAAPTEVR
jgi:hypothetical protein